MRDVGAALFIAAFCVLFWPVVLTVALLALPWRV